MSNRIGDLTSVDNTQKHWAANSKYNFIRVQLENGKEVELLFTDNEIKNAIIRADKNKEDLPKTSFIRNLFD